MATDLEQFTVYAPPKLVKHLKMLAESDGRTLSNFVVRALVGCVGGHVDSRGVYSLYARDGAGHDYDAPPVSKGRISDDAQVYIAGAVAAAVQRPPVRSLPKQRQGEECACGSGKKFKHCHGRRP
jgi:SEC-C motif